MNIATFLDPGACERLILAHAHFLWQGAAVWLSLWLAGPLLRRAPGPARYRILVAALLILAICPPVNFAVLERLGGVPGSHPLAEGASGKAANLPAGAVELDAGREKLSPELALQSSSSGPNHPQGSSAVPSGARTALSLSACAPYLSALYLLGVALMVGRLVRGVGGTRRLRRTAQPVEDPGVLEVFKGKAMELGLTVLPAIALCREIAVPTVIGILRPMILIPLSTTSGMSPGEIEMVLAHELAHIRRRDHLINIVQGIIEALLFFHPAVWSISKRIRTEREYLCDDLVLSSGGTAHRYAGLLVEIGRRALGPGASPLGSAASLGAAGSSSSLRPRVLRLLDGSAFRKSRLSPLARLLIAGVAFLAPMALFWPLGWGSQGGKERVEEPKAEDPPKASPPAPGLEDRGAKAPVPYNGRFEGKRNLLARGGGGGTEEAVIAGLRWLARHQDAGGSWSVDGFSANCRGSPKCGGPGSLHHDVGITGLSLLAFLGAGYLPGGEVRFEDPLVQGRAIRAGDTVRSGLRWLLDRQDPEGCFGKQEGEFMYDHAIAAMAMAEAAWLTKASPYPEAAQRGIDFLCKARNPGFAWRYSVRPGDNDTSVTGWAVMALKSADLAGLKFDPAAYEGARTWLRRVTSSAGLVGYESPGDQGSVLPGVNDKWQSHPSMTAVGLLLDAVSGGKANPWMERAADILAKDLPVYDREKKTIDFYYWYYSPMALFQLEAPNGPHWKTFNASMKRALVPFQKGYQASGEKAAKPGCADGSWDPEPDKWGSAGGRVYATALNVLTLEVYYRYPRFLEDRDVNAGGAEGR